MRRRIVTILLLVLFGAWTAAFVAGHMTSPAKAGPNGSVCPVWLQGASEQAVNLEQGFQTLACQLEKEWHQQQEVLLGLLEDPCSTDERIGAQVSVVCRCHEDLIRAVGRHVAEIHRALPASQRRYLMQSCGRLQEQEIRKRYRWRGGADPAAFQDRPRVNGRGGAGGTGRARGQRHRWGRQGGAVQRGLRLTDDQLTLARQLDPLFDEDASRLKEQVAAAHVALMGVFEEAGPLDSRFDSAINALAAAHLAMEQRVAQHVLLLRPHLTSEQIRCLIGLCRGSLP